MAHLKISLPDEQSPLNEHDDPPPYAASQDALIPDHDASSRQPSILPSKRDFYHTVHSHSSSQSLVPPPRSSSDSRRTLLLVYIHGFYGNDQSFRSFPAHVHRYLNASPLSQSHLIHSKVYPRYKTYKAIDVARDNFSAWLEPHESPTTDVILIGHSMGGLLAAEVVLKPSDIFQHQHPFKHRILGTLSLDSPFLGLHPGIVVSGISSLFRPETQPPTNADAGVEVDVGTSSTPELQPSFQGRPPPRQPTDPTFDPPYFNDAPFKEKPLFYRLVNFASKHSSEGLLNALGNHITHHLEFGGCLADYHGLMSRYNRLRALEDVDETNTAQHSTFATPSRVRVRFVNYYTLCPGRPKPVKSPSEQSRSLSQTDLSTTASTHDEAPTEHVDDDSPIAMEAAQSPAQVSPTASFSSILPLQELEPIPIAEPDNHPKHPEQKPMSQDDTDSQTDQLSSQLTLDSLSLLPNIPPPSPPPAKPEAPDFSQFADKDTRKQAEKEFARREKSYNDALKLHAKTLRERQKLLDKQSKQLQKENEKKLKDAKKEADKSIKEAQRLEKVAAKGKHRLEKQEKKRLEKEASEAAAAAAAAVDKPKKLKKFCNVPSKINGVMDRTWVSVYMGGVDEVGAHCGLFVPGEHYEKLVEDVGGRIVAWLHDE